MTARDISNLNRIIYTTVLFGAAFATMTTTLIGVTLPDIQCLLGVDLKTSSSLLFAYGLGLCCSNLTVHVINGKVDSCLFLVAILVLNAVVIAAVPTSPFLWLTIFLILIAGWCTGISIFSTIERALVRKKRYVTRQELILTQNRGATVLIQYPYIIMSGLSLLVASGLMCCYNTVLKDGDVMDVPPPIKRKSSVKRSTSPMFMCLTMCFSFTCYTCIVSFQELFVTFGICTQLNLSLSDMSRIYCVFSAAVLLSRLIGVVLSARLSLDMVMVLFSLLSGVTSVLFLIFRDTSIFMMWTNSLLFAVGIGPIFPGWLAWVKENMHGSPRFLNAILFSDFIAFLISPPICGLMMDMIGANAFVYMVSGAGLLQCVLFMFMSWDNWKRKRNNN